MFNLDGCLIGVLQLTTAWLIQITVSALVVVVCVLLNIQYIDIYSINKWFRITLSSQWITFHRRLVVSPNDPVSRVRVQQLGGVPCRQFISIESRARPSHLHIRSWMCFGVYIYLQHSSTTLGDHAKRPELLRETVHFAWRVGR